jgi:Xaa-Pro aminopeptidase
MQVDVIQSLAPGVKYRDMHLLASRICIEGLKSIGIMKGNTEDAISSGAHALFFPHGLGHMLGLDVHDMDALGEDNVGYDSEIVRDSQFGLSYLRLGKALQCGNVLTVEPGIYFISALIGQWEQKGKHKEFINYSSLKSFRDFGGIRIEDDVLIKNDGCDCLSYDIPKNISEIEKIMGNGSA